MNLFRFPRCFFRLRDAIHAEERELARNRALCEEASRALEREREAFMVRQTRRFGFFDVTSVSTRGLSRAAHHVSR